ncbi:F-box protein [Rosa sericea]
MARHTYNLRSNKSRKLEDDPNPELPIELRGAEIIPTEVRDAQILARLPAKDRMRFKCVSKSWSSLTRNLDLVRAYRKFNKQTHLLFFVWDGNRNRQYFFSVQTNPTGISNRTPATHLFSIELSPCPFPFTTHMRGVNGLTFVHNAYGTLTSEEHDSIYVLNPCSRELFNLPRVTNQRAHHIYHFGFCTSATNEYYKVLLVEESPNEKCVFKIYTLGSHTSWRHIENNEVTNTLPFDVKSRSFADSSSSVCVDGVIYWTQRRSATSNPVPHETSLIRIMEFERAETLIVAFDVEDEKFRVIPPPRACSCSNAVMFNKIVEVCGCVALLYVIEQQQQIELWVLRDSRNHRWVKETIRAPFPVMGLGRRALYRILTRGKFVFLRGDDRVFYYDMESRSLDGSEIIWPQGIRGMREWLRLVEMYDDTIVSLR